MSLRAVEPHSRGGLAVSRASLEAVRQLRAMSALRKRVEIAVVEKLNPSVSIDSLPLAMLIAILASLFAGRRH